MTDTVRDRTDLDQLCINTIRTLAMDAVQRASSGHPGAPMGLAPLGYVLWTRHMKHNPANPAWVDRDRFVLSCGHASMLLYAMLHLAGYDLTLEDIKRFRQWGSKTPGHPEFGYTPGVETTTGPLGQGFGNAVGMALAEARLAAEFNREGHTVVDHHTYFFASDGDMMEGISHEVASIAGHLKLGKLIGFYDDNGITIDGETSLTFSDDTVARFAAYGWHVQRVADGNDLAAIDAAIANAKSDDRPSLIAVATHIGYGSPNKQDTAASHGAPLGEDEVRLTKASLEWDNEDPFHVPADSLEQWRMCLSRGAEWEAEYATRLAAYRTEFPELAAELDRRLAGHLRPGWDELLPAFDESNGTLATRAASGIVINAIADAVPELVGGSADLSGSNNTLIKDGADLSADDLAARNFRYGIREHGMAAIMNGMALHGGFVPYGGTFLVFADYMRPAVRLASLMRQHVIYVFTHDSIGLGEDGPTHQPVEHLTALRVIPGLKTVRPGDSNEVVEAWRFALEHRDGPVAIALTRQKVSLVPRERYAAAIGLRRGAYILNPDVTDPAVAVIATGSELALALGAAEHLEAEGVATRVVSAPCLEIFAEQPDSYREAVLPPGIPRLAVEAAHPLSWRHVVGDHGAVLGIDRFGASAPHGKLFEEYGLTVDAVVAAARALLSP